MGAWERGRKILGRGDAETPRRGGNTGGGEWARGGVGVNPEPEPEPESETEPVIPDATICHGDAESEDGES